jgi:hypothetical protein
MTERTLWRIVGEEIGACNCAWGCPCQFNALPTHGRCEGVLAASIREGHYGATRLDGVTFGMTIWFPGPIHEGKGIMQPVVDERATSEQRTAVLNIIKAIDGGMPWEIFAAVTETFLDPLFVPIEFETNRDTRVARLRVPGVAELRSEPIRDPITGQEHRAIIKLPDGFEYKEAEMADAVVLEASVGGKTIRHQHTYTQLCAIEWSNS